MKKKFLFLLAILSALAGWGQEIVLDSIRIEGNNRTRDYLVLRELTLSKGDTLSNEELEESIRTSKANLLNTSLFNFVEISLENQGGTYVLTVLLQERWYLWPYPKIYLRDQNINAWLEDKDWKRLTAGVLLEHQNFLGKRQVFRLLFTRGWENSEGISWLFPFIDKKKTLGIKGTYLHLSQSSVYADIDSARWELFEHQGQKIQDFHLFQWTLTWRPQYRFRHEFSLEQRRKEVHHTVEEINPSYFPRYGNPLWLYGARYSFEFQGTDYKFYPQEGSYFKGELSFEKAKEDYGRTSFRMKAARFQPLFNRAFLGVGGILSGSYAQGNENWQYNRLIVGMDDYVRGYETELIPAELFYTLKLDAKYKVLDQWTKQLPLIKNPAFSKLFFSVFVGPFVDIGQAAGSGNDKEKSHWVNQTMASAGLGMVILSYYDSLFRIEYSVNLENQRGFKVFFIAPF